MVENPALYEMLLQDLIPPTANKRYESGWVDRQKKSFLGRAVGSDSLGLFF